MLKGRATRFSQAVAALVLTAVACGGSGDVNPDLPGITEETIKIGLWWSDNSNSCEQLGVTEPERACGAGDERTFLNLVEYVNDNGGMAGRTVEPVVYRTTFSGSFTTAGQQACTYFTQDELVYAAIVVNNIFGEFARCFTQNQVITIDPGTHPHDNQDFIDMDPYLYQPNRPRPERWIKAWIEALEGEGFFDGDARLGLIWYDYPSSIRVMDSTLRPLLEENDITIVEEARVPHPTSAEDLAVLETSAQSLILRFKNAGVNRVMSFTDIGFINNFLIPGAAAQEFFPRYGFNGNEFMTFFASLGAPGQLDGSIGIGWNPNYDTPGPHQPEPGPASERCRDIVNDPDGTPTGRNNVCDSVLFLKAAFDKAQEMGDVTPEGLRAAVASLGTSYQPAEVMSTKFGPGLYDGPATYRIYEYDSDCSCMQYTSPERPMPDDPVPGLD